MSIVGQWQAIQEGLPEGWADARLRLTVADEDDGGRAAALLGPAIPGRRGKVISFHVTQRGSGASPALAGRLLERLDGERIDATLELVGTTEVSKAVAEERQSFVADWDAALAALPGDWSDLYAEVELDSSDYLDRAALLLAPVNPARDGIRLAFRFRAARRFGYGVSTEMARRCLERLDAEGTRGTVRVLRALSDTRPVQTQGPVWYVGGKSV
ncbi:MAG TPA: hypothetical protein VEG40_03505 [Gaiellaceae bacterium]|nr:hypothetical protein [Gaiellaceae bacterium]